MDRSFKSKVCIAFYGVVADERHETMVFVVDLLPSNQSKLWQRIRLSADGLTLSVDYPSVDRLDTMIPTVRLDSESFNTPAVCLLGSKLYVFDGYHRIQENQNYEEKFNTDGKSVFTYQLSEGVSDLKLEKHMMHKEEARMNHTKVLPKATVTPDGKKILVYSSLIEVFGLEENDYEFELYDLDTHIWQKLPNLPVSYRQGTEYAAISVMSHTFINTNVFFLRTEVGGFTLDLKNPIEWKTGGSGFCGDEDMPSQYCDSFVVIGKELCLLPDSAFDISVRGGTQGVCPSDRENIFNTIEYTFPETSPLPPLSMPEIGITLLDYNKKHKFFRVCLLRSGINEETGHPEVFLSVYETHLPSCKKELKAYRKNKVKEHPIWWKRKKESFVLPGTLKVQDVRIVVAEKSPYFILCSFSSTSSCAPSLRSRNS